MNGEYELESKVSDDDSTQIVVGENIIVNLDLKLDGKLIREGISRDVIRMIQNLRREKGLDVSNFIEIYINAEEIITDSVKENYSYICSQVLASKISFDNNVIDGSEKIAGHKLSLIHI